MIRNLLVMATMVVGATALAQPSSNGTARVHGTVSPAISMYFGASTASAGIIQTGNVADTALAYVADFGDLGSPTTPGYNRVNLTLNLRSNIPYLLSAYVTDNVTGGSVITSDKIGFALTGASATDATRVATRSGFDATGVADPTTFDVANAAFYNTAGNNGSDPDAPDFLSTLADMGTTFGTATALLEGPRISNGGGFTSTNNKLEVGTEFAILPEMLLASGSFDYTVTFTLTTP